MKRFIISVAVMTVVAMFLAFLYFGTTIVIDLNPNAPLETWSRTEDKTIQINTGDGWEDFEIRGVDMGIGIPGHFATDYAIDKDTYLRWFKLIKEMGANTVRVYILQSPSFYEALLEYNTDNPDPLYLIHGVWIDDYNQNSHMDGFDPDYKDRFISDCRTVVDVIHGRRWVELGRLTASGMFVYDVSEWVLGYIIGVEWEAPTVAYTDNSNELIGSYHGKYISTTSDASAFEIMLAEVGDDMLNYEAARYKEQRLLAFSNWATTDPFDYPRAIEVFFEKYTKVDVENIVAEDALVSGMFASYHIYPYYPDYLQYLPQYANYVDKYGDNNTYLAYLETLADYHTMPVVISEFGIPSARGSAQVDANTNRNQGSMSESDQGLALVRCYDDIMTAGCSGCCVFAWQDEWFKRTWNTMANVDLLETPFWSDYQTNEQYFGLMSFDPGNDRSKSYVDEDREEWTEDDIIGTSDGRTLSMKYDEKFIYFMVEGSDVNEGTKLYLPIDTTQKSGSKTSINPHVTFDRAADFLIVLDGKNNSRVLVQERYEVLRAMQLRAMTGEDPYIDIPASDSSNFMHIDLLLQTLTDTSVIKNAVPDDKIPVTDKYFYKSYETGKLTYGNANPANKDYNSLADFCFGGGFVEIKIPWQLLNFSNPSDMQIHDDYYEHYGVENMSLDTMYIGIGDGDDTISLFSKKMVGWGETVTYHERLKESYFIMQQLWANDVSPEALLAENSPEVAAAEEAARKAAAEAVSGDES
ncbi:MULTISPECIES: hypothetical protein [Collinsella]|uniref:hypothetical protein n=1 Tax=Collinsella TaxID=102106 RepID=UPI000B1CC347|nr:MULTISPECIES: hypothetical protein [Collinsella]